MWYRGQSHPRCGSRYTRHHTTTALRRRSRGSGCPRARGTDWYTAPRGAYACVVRPPAQPSVHYSAQCPIVVRAVLSPCTHTAALPLRDILDTYHAAGIDITAEVAAATVSIRRAAQLAVREARHRGVSRIALVIKAATKYKNVNGVFTKVATQAIEEAGMSMEIIHTSQASNDLVVFPERHGVVLVNDIPSCENVQLAYAGVTGGRRWSIMWRAPREVMPRRGGRLPAARRRRRRR